MEGRTIATSIYQWAIKTERDFRCPMIFGEEFNLRFNSEDEARKMVDVCYPEESRNENWILLHYTISETSRFPDINEKEISDDTRGIQSVPTIQL